METFVKVVGAIVVFLAISLGLDFLYAWLFSVAINHTFQTHYPAFKFFWLMIVTGSWLSVVVATCVKNVIKK